MKKQIIETQLPNGKIRRRVIHTSDEPSMTQQHLKEQCDVNSILARYAKTGFLSHTAITEGQYGDFTVFTDLQSSIETVRQAQDSFSQLPAVIRARFGNDPQNLIDFVQNPKNSAEAIKLGLAVKRVTPPAAQNDDQTTITQATLTNLPA